MYIEDCLNGTKKLFESDFRDPLNTLMPKYPKKINEKNVLSLFWFNNKLELLFINIIK